MSGADASLPATTDVVIVGAGPTGLALAIGLRRLGVDAVVIDLAGSIDDRTRAAGVQPRTLEDLTRLGAAEALLDRGLRGVGFRASGPDGPLLEIDFGVLSTPYPFVLLVAQSVTEEVLRDTLDSLGGSVLTHHRLLDFDDEFDGVTARIADPDGAMHAVRAQYLVGCDGLHSGVRTRAGIGFSGAERDEAFALADVRTAEPPEVSRVDFTFSPEGLLLRSPLPDTMLRVVATTTADAAPLDLDAAQALVDARSASGDSTKITEVVQASLYRVTSRMAERFSQGRTFLAGDAAHVHSPAGGQGMNTGIQDAVNLAWRLAAVLGGDDPGLLDDYDAERRPNAAAVLAVTAQITDLAAMADPQAMALRDEVLRTVGGIAAVPVALADKLSQLNIDYRDPAAPAPDPVGRRLPLDQPPAVGLEWTTATLADGRTAHVRPDGYVAEVSDGG